MRASTNKNNFTSGEITPLLEGRGDLEAYHKGLEESENMQILEHGGITRRPGTRYVDESKDSTKVSRLIPFVVSEDAAYMLEFGTGYIRVFKGTVLQQISSTSSNLMVNGSFDADIASWTDTSDAGANASWSGANLALALYAPKFVEASAEQYVATATIGKTYRATFKVLGTTPSNFGGVGAAFGNTSGGTEYDEFGGVSSTEDKYFTSVDFVATSTTIGIRLLWVPINAAGTIYIDDVLIYEVTTSTFISTAFLESDIFDIQFAQANDVMWLSHSNHAPQKLSRLNDNDWTLADEVFERGPFEPLTLKSQDVLSTGGALLKLGTTYLEGETGISVYPGASSGMLGSANNGEIFYMVDETDPSKYVVVELGTWNGVAVAFLSSTLKTDCPSELQDVRTRLWSRQAWTALRGYPAAVGLYEQRLCFASTTTYPQVLWCSASGGLTYFLPGVADDDSLTYNMTSKKQNPIRWISETANLVLGGMSGEWSVRGGGLGDPITPTNIIPRLASKNGVATVSPADVGDDLAFVQRAGRRILVMVSNDDSLYHSVIDLSLMSEHLMTAYSIKQLSFQREKNSILYAVRNDGVLLACTYNREQNTMAWSRFIVEGGEIESVATVPKQTADQVWVIVKRNINGSEVRYLEYLDELDWRISDDPYYVDSGASYIGAATSIITGLDHLEGETVQAYSGGEYIGDYTVASGSVSLNEDVTQAHIGLGFTSKIKELPNPTGSPDGSSHGRQKRKSKTVVRIYKTQAIKVNDDLVSLPRDNPSVTKPELFTGLVEDNNLGWDKDAANTIESVGPNPLTILSIDTTLTVGSE